MTSVSGKAIAELAKPLEIYLPREMAIDNDAPSLGNVAILRGDESLIAKAEKVSLGQFSSPTQKITLDRKSVLSRLVCCGIPAYKVKLSGADEITISQQHQVIKGNEFVEKAVSFLTANPPHPSVCQYSALRTPQDLILSDVNEMPRLVANLAENNSKNQVKVVVTAFIGNKDTESREVVFFLKYNCRRVAAKIDIQEGEIISPENIKVENIISTNPEPTDWAIPYGFIARRSIPANTAIAADMVEEVKPQIVLKRNQNVLIKVDRFGLVVTAIGRTLQDGRAGEYIKVQNLSSQRVILVQVKEDGSVEPVF